MPTTKEKPAPAVQPGPTQEFLEGLNVSQAEQAAAWISGNASGFTKGVLLPVSCRLPVWVVESLDAMSTRAGRSRNFTLNLVIAAGIEATLEHLSLEIRDDIRRIANEQHEPIDEVMKQPGVASGEVE